MWKLIIADSFHFNKISFQTNFYFLGASIYFNTLIQAKASIYTIILLVLLLSLMISMMLSPIRIAKGLYLCPLTERDRKRYLKAACFFHYIFYEVVFAVILIFTSLVYHFNLRVLLFIFICISVVYLTILLLTGFYNPEMVKKQYFIVNKLPLPSKKQTAEGKYETPLKGIYLLVTALILSSIGLLLPGFVKSYQDWWLLYYIPAFFLCFTCILLYFRRYFDLFITINANYEMYSYAGKKKAGVFHAD